MSNLSSLWPHLRTQIEDSTLDSPLPPRRPHSGSDVILAVDTFQLTDALGTGPSAVLGGFCSIREA